MLPAVITINCVVCGMVYGFFTRYFEADAQGSDGFAV